MRHNSLRNFIIFYVITLRQPHFECSKKKARVPEKIGFQMYLVGFQEQIRCHNLGIRIKMSFEFIRRKIAQSNHKIDDGKVFRTSQFSGRKSV